MSSEDIETAQHLVDGYKEIIGEAAIGIARNNDYVTVDNGEITGLDDGEDALLSLVEDYHEILGDIAYHIAQKHAPELDLTGSS
jgi:hypothetical protein